MESGNLEEVVGRCLALIPLVRENQGIALDELAQLSRLPAEQIAGELSQVMLMCGVPPYFPHDYVTFILDENRVSIHFADQFRRPVSLNPLEALSLKLACESLVPPGRPVPRALATLLRKVESAMSREQRRQFRNLSRRVLTTEPGDSAGPLAGRAAMALAERRVVRLDYRAAGRPDSRARPVEPYGLLRSEGRWYLVGFDRSREKIIHFRLDRIVSLAATGERFEIPSNFRLDDFATPGASDEDAGLPVARIRFRGPAARWMRETAAPGTLQEEGDGSVLWSPGIGSEEGLASFLAGFGDGVSILDPASLRMRVQGILAAVIAAHEGPPSAGARGP